MFFARTQWLNREPTHRGKAGYRNSTNTHDKQSPAHIHNVEFVPKQLEKRLVKHFLFAEHVQRHQERHHKEQLQGRKLDYMDTMCH
jgi:hypothetical protein